MENQLELFDTKHLGIAPIINILRSNILLHQWRPFSVDTVKKAATLYGVSCGVVLDTYERVIHEQDGNDPDD